MKKREKIFIKRIIDAIKNDELYDKLIKKMDKTFCKGDKIKNAARERPGKI